MYSETAEQHLADVRQTLQRLRENALKAKRAKCNINKKSVEYLGHIIEAGQVKMDPEKIRAVKEWPVPTSVRQL